MDFRKNVFAGSIGIIGVGLVIGILAAFLQKCGNPGNMGIWSGLNFGFAYDLPMNTDRTFIITPEISYSLGLNDIVDSTNWKANSLSFGLSLAYSPKAEPKTEILAIKSMKIDTLIVPQSNEPLNEFTANADLLFGSYPSLFMCGKGSSTQ